jgi:hypothetical protein
MQPTTVPGRISRGMEDFMARLSDETKFKVCCRFQDFHNSAKKPKRVKIIFQQSVTPDMLTESHICWEQWSERDFIYIQGLTHGAMVKRIFCHSMSFVRGGANAFKKMGGESCIPDRVAEYWARYDRKTCFETMWSNGDNRSMRDYVVYEKPCCNQTAWRPRLRNHAVTRL